MLRADPGQLIGGGAHFIGGFGLGAVGPEQACMHLLLCKRRLPPAEIARQLGAMRGCLERPQRHHPRQRRRIEARPVYRPGLLLHHPPAPARAPTIKIVVEGRDVGVALAQIGLLLFGGEPELLEKAERVGIPCRHINIAAYSVVIELGEETHEIVRDILSR